MIESVDLDRHEWEHRVILLFAPSDENASYATMRDALAERPEGVADRDLVVYHLFFDDAGRVGDRRVTPEAAAALAAEYDAPRDGFTYVLIGKDGTVKNRAAQPVAVDNIFARIDAMPMRQREMQEREE